MTEARLAGVLLVLLAVSLEALGQLSFKQAVVPARSARSALWGVSPGWLVLGILLFVAEIATWTFVLRALDVSIAFPLGSLSFVLVVLLSRIWLKETISRRRWAGLWSIIAGAVVLQVA